VRSESSAAAALARRAESAVGTLRRKLSFERKGDNENQRKGGAQQRKRESALGSESAQGESDAGEEPPCPDEAGTQPPSSTAAAAAAAAVSVGTVSLLARKLSFGRKTSFERRAKTLAPVPVAPRSAPAPGVSLSDVLQSTRCGPECGASCA